MPKAIDDELLAECRNDRSRYGGGSELMFFNVPEDGKKHTIRVLPGMFGKSGKKWFVTSAQHWASKKPYECPRKAKDDFCPFCEAVDDLRLKEAEVKNKLKKADDVTAMKLERQQKKLGKMISNLLPKARFMVNIIDRSEGMLVVRIFRMPKSVFDVVFNTWESQEEDILDENSGHDFIITREKKNGRTSYSATPALSKNAVAKSQEEIDKLLEKRPNLEKMVKIESREELEKVCVDALGEIQRQVSAEVDAEAEGNGGERKKASVTFDEDETPSAGSKASAGKTAEDKAAAKRAALEDAKSDLAALPTDDEETITPVADKKPTPDDETPAPSATASLKSQLAGILGDDED